MLFFSSFLVSYFFLKFTYIHTNIIWCYIIFWKLGMLEKDINKMKKLMKENEAIMEKEWSSKAFCDRGREGNNIHLAFWMVNCWVYKNDNVCWMIQKTFQFIVIGRRYSYCRWSMDLDELVVENQKRFHTMILYLDGKKICIFSIFTLLFLISFIT